MKEQKFSKIQIFNESLSRALLIPFFLVGCGMLVISQNFMAALYLASCSLFFHFLSYLLLAPILFLFLGPRSVLWSYQWGLPAGFFLGGAVAILPLTMAGARLHEAGVVLLSGSGYGYLTAFAIITARATLLEQQSELLTDKL